jgi:hypothetical protein
MDEHDGVGVLGRDRSDERRNNAERDLLTICWQRALHRDPGRPFVLVDLASHNTNSAPPAKGPALSL